jgi:hypothetical protein
MPKKPGFSRLVLSAAEVGTERLLLRRAIILKVLAILSSLGHQTVISYACSIVEAKKGKRRFAYNRSPEARLFTLPPKKPGFSRQACVDREMI